jgi:glycosyltransferase involved in cell wall biosynthesis
MTKLSILFAYRNREVSRIKSSLESLAQQQNQDFEVIFVDYGSDDSYSNQVKQVLDSFDFVNYYYIAHPGLLWNKSKALNFGAERANGSSIFIADVDLLFDPKATHLLNLKELDNSFYLFQLGYLDEAQSKNIYGKHRFEELKVKHYGTINGMVLVSKDAFFTVNGLDEFFHFYGSEDVDFYSRLERSGLQRLNCEEKYFNHIWHRIYNSYDDSKFDVIPRHFNIKKINLQHHLQNNELKVTKPYTNATDDLVYSKKDAVVLEAPEIIISMNNEQAKVWHFLNVTLNNYSGKIIELIINEDFYFKSAKFRIKRILKKSDRVPISMKQASDLILGIIISKFRHHNYRFIISNDLKSIVWTIQL